MGSGEEAILFSSLEIAARILSLIILTFKVRQYMSDRKRMSCSRLFKTGLLATVNLVGTKYPGEPSQPCETKKKASSKIFHNSKFR